MAEAPVAVEVTAVATAAVAAAAAAAPPSPPPPAARPLPPPPLVQDEEEGGATPEGEAEEVLAQAMAMIHRQIPPQVTAAEIMTKSVVTIAPERRWSTRSRS